MAYASFEKLEVWHKACRIAVELYKVLSDCRDFGLKDQMTRTAVSIASNIAEGSERGTRADYIRFLRIAKGSAAELRTQIYIASRIGHVFPSSVVPNLVDELKSISSMLQGLIDSLNR